MKNLQIVGERVGRGRFDCIYQGTLWYGFKVDYRKLFFIVVTLLVAITVKAILFAPRQDLPQKRNIIKQSPLRLRHAQIGS